LQRQGKPSGGHDDRLRFAIGAESPGSAREQGIASSVENHGRNLYEKRFCFHRSGTSRLREKFLKRKPSHQYTVMQWGDDKLDADLTHVAANQIESVFPRRTNVLLRRTDGGGVGVYRSESNGSRLGVLDVDLDGELSNYAVEIRSVRRPAPSESGDGPWGNAGITVRVTRKDTDEQRATRMANETASEITTNDITNKHGAAIHDAYNAALSEARAQEDLALFSEGDLRRLAGDTRLRNALISDEDLLKWVHRVVKAPTWDDKRAIVRRLLAEDSSGCKELVESLMADND
jgi:hypothetical protein